MKKLNILLTLSGALLLSPAIASAATPDSPGKASDAVKEPAVEAPARPAAGAEIPKSPGKASDAVRENAQVRKPGRTLMGTVESMDKAAKTVTVKNAKGKSVVLQVGDATVMKKGAGKATWEDLKAGAKVETLFVRDGEMRRASSVTITE